MKKLVFAQGKRCKQRVTIKNCTHLSIRRENSTDAEHTLCNVRSVLAVRDSGASHAAQESVCFGEEEGEERACFDSSKRR